MQIVTNGLKISESSLTAVLRSPNLRLLYLKEVGQEFQCVRCMKLQRLGYYHSVRINNI
jgi:hypothetical protein